jgi:hypothetical protein
VELLEDKHSLEGGKKKERTEKKWWKKTEKCILLCYSTGYNMALRRLNG